MVGLAHMEDHNNVEKLLYVGIRISTDIDCRLYLQEHGCVICRKTCAGVEKHASHPNDW
jgi:hypothetical protein